jgi:hypothetical protein
MNALTPIRPDCRGDTTIDSKLAFLARARMTTPADDDPTLADACGIFPQARLVGAGLRE